MFFIKTDKKTVKKSFVLAGGIFVFVFILNFSFFIFNSSAAPDQELTYHGKLTDNLGLAVPNDTYTFDLTIYDATDAPIWTDTQTLTVTNGIFSTTLDTLDTLTFDQNYTLGVQINSNPEMTPRRKITPTGFALNAHRLNGLTADNYIDTSASAQTKQGDLTVNGTLTLGSDILPDTDDTYTLGDTAHRWQDLFLGPSSLHIGSSTTDEGVISYDTTNNILNIGTDTATNGDIAFNTDQIYVDNSSGNVGIGTTNPNYNFEVAGSSHLGVDSTNRTWFGDGTFTDVGSPGYMYASAATLNAGFTANRDSMGAYASFDLLSSHSGSTGWSIQMQPSDTNLYIFDRVNGVNMVTFKNDGNVGIGTASLSERLTVNGAINIGNTSATHAGTMRWNGSDFEGYDGLSWLSLTSGGGSSTFLGLTDTPSVYTNGSILFTSGSAVTEDNERLFWDDINKRLGIGTNTPVTALDVNGGIKFGTESSICNAAFAGTARYNSTGHVLELCNGTTWTEISSGSGAGVGETIPAGTVVAYTTSACPTNWVAAEGQAISRTSYPDLFTTISTMYGSGDGSTTFNVPDYRGEFLRGWAHGSANDPDRTTRTNRGDGTIGDAVGTKQVDVFESHLHSVDPPSTATNSAGAHTHTTTAENINASGSGIFPGSGYSISAGSVGSAGAHTHTVDILAFDSANTGGNETRSRNVNVLYCIKSTNSAGGDYLATLWDTDVDTGIQVEETADEDIIRFDTAGAERMTLTASGNLGLGTTSPSSFLDLQQNGTAKANTDMLELTNSGNATDMDVTSSSILFNQYYYDATTPAVVDSARLTVGTEQDWTSAATTQDSYMAFSTALDGALTERMRISSDGDVGIGTAVPVAKLNVNKTYSTATGVNQNGILLQTNYSIADTGSKWGTSSILTLSHTSGTIVDAVAAGGSAIKSGTGTVTNVSGLWSRVDNINATGVITNAYGLYIDDSIETGTITNDYGIYQVDTGAKNYFGGNVGIGTTSPQTKLQIFGPSQDVSTYGIMSLDTNIGTNDVGIKIGAVAGAGSAGYSFIQSKHTGTINDGNMILNPGGGNVGIGVTNATESFTVFNGSTTGTYTTTGWVHSSDKKLKTHVTPIDDPLQKVLALNDVYFNWKTNPDSNRQIGFIAQDVKKIIPEVVVGSDKNGYGISYGNLTALLVGAVQEQSVLIETNTNNLTTKATATSLLDLQNMTDKQFTEVSRLLRSTRNDDETVQNDILALQEDANAQSHVLDEIMLRISDVENMHTELLDFYTKVDADRLVFVDEENNLTIDGVMIASRMEANALAITGEEDGAMIGEAVIVVDTYDVFVPTTAVVQNSRIFVTPKNGVVTQILSITRIDEHSGFHVTVADPADKPIMFDWLIVEDRVVRDLENDTQIDLQNKDEDEMEIIQSVANTETEQEDANTQKTTDEAEESAMQLINQNTE